MFATPTRISTLYTVELVKYGKHIGAVSPRGSCLTGGYSLFKRITWGIRHMVPPLLTLHPLLPRPRRSLGVSVSSQLYVMQRMVDCSMVIPNGNLLS